MPSTFEVFVGEGLIVVIKQAEPPHLSTIRQENALYHGWRVRAVEQEQNGYRSNSGIGEQETGQYPRACR